MLPSAPSAVSLAVVIVAVTPATEVPVPPFAIGRTPLTCVVRLTPLSVPPSIKLPEPVTVPVRVKPETVPVPLTLVTEPPPLLLNVVQSVELSAPRLVAEAVGTFKVITTFVVGLATVELKLVPAVPSVKAATLETDPAPPEPRFCDKSRNHRSQIGLNAAFPETSSITTGKAQVGGG